MDVYKEISLRKLVPVVKLDNAADAEPLMAALIGGGLPVAEITFRTDAARDSIAAISGKYPEALVGAGSLTSVRQAEDAVAAGAKFLVSAGFSEEIVKYALVQGIPYMPGICTPTELMKLVEYGLPVAKFFPAENCGGVKTIKAIAAAFPTMKFMPTGGINASNVLDYLSFDKIIACGGSWMVKTSMMNAHELEKIEELTRQAVALVAGNR